MSKRIEFQVGRFHGYAGDLSDSPEVKALLGRFGTRGEGRGNAVMVRLSDDALARIDQLVEATLFGSRSEATAFLIGAGIESQRELLGRLSAHTGEIRKLKAQLQKIALDALKPKK